MYLSDQNLNSLYPYDVHHHGNNPERFKGMGIGDDINNFFKSTHIASSVGEVLLPLAGGFVGAFGGPLGGIVGSAVGSSLNQGIKSLGYGEAPILHNLYSQNGIVHSVQFNTTAPLNTRIQN